MRHGTVLAFPFHHLHHTHLGPEHGANEVVVEEGAESVVDHATRFEYNIACFLETFVHNDVISRATDIRNQRY